jgi:ectoine hydroxylase-related dioxygenase (phytanoyl-CoA dioxygenase family)
MIPKFHSNNINNIYNSFYNTYGCIILKNVFDENIMNEYNSWCYSQFNNLQQNNTHPKQKDKIIINNILELLSNDNPNLLLKIINNPFLNKVLDTLLGHACFGSLTTHCIKPHGQRQLSHVDYPLHVGSGQFWENNPNLIDKYITEYQLNYVLTHFSIQCLIASDAMSKENGSTEVIPASHLIHNVDKKILNKTFYDSVNNKFINVTLEQGDVLLFNRGLLHRGGHNLSDKNRNSLIIQYVWLFGIGQHKHNHDTIISNILNSEEYTKLNPQEKIDLLLRIKQPYPIDTTINN